MARVFPRPKGIGSLAGLVCLLLAGWAAGCGDDSAVSSQCGNGVAEDGEQCDGQDLRGYQCWSISAGFDYTPALRCTADCRFDTSQCQASECGNGEAEPGEDCDAPDMRGVRCEDLGLGFVGGSLGCDADCRFDVTNCLVEGGGQMPVCGDGLASGFEDCDGTDLRQLHCADLVGFKGGTLACDPDCRFDTSGCEPTVCGDGVRDAGEECDGQDLGDSTCEGLGIGFVGGQLGCDDTCHLDFSGCTVDAICGNGFAEGGEQCDGPDLRNQECWTIGFSYGTLRCDDECRLDWSGCRGDRCEISNLYGDGLCDACEAYGGHRDPDCDACSLSDGQCSPPDQVDPLLMGSTCELVTGARDPDCGTCGDGVRSEAELCDGQDVGQWRCNDFGYAEGQVSCLADCTLDISGCAGFCGDNHRNPGEACDWMDLAGQTCESLGLGSGTLLCREDCTWDTSGCEHFQPVCGDGVAMALEQCDGAEIDSRYTCENLGFSGGELACRDGCLLDVSGCEGDWCALNGAYGDGVCDPCDQYNGQGHRDPDCDACGIADGLCFPPDQATRFWNASACELVTGARDPDCGTCGDGVADDVEECDGQDFHGMTCASFGLEGTGQLHCTSDCRVQVNDCIYNRE